MADLGPDSRQSGLALPGNVGRRCPAGKPEGNVRLRLRQAVDPGQSPSHGGIEMHVHDCDEGCLLHPGFRPCTKRDPGEQETGVQSLGPEPCRQESERLIRFIHRITLQPAVQRRPRLTAQPEFTQSLRRLSAEEVQTGFIEAQNVAIGAQDQGRPRHLAGKDTGCFLARLFTPHAVQDGERTLEMGVHPVRQEEVIPILRQLADIFEPGGQQGIISFRIECGGIGFFHNRLDRVCRLGDGRLFLFTRSSHQAPCPSDKITALSSILMMRAHSEGGKKNHTPLE